MRCQMVDKKAAIEYLVRVSIFGFAKTLVRSPWVKHLLFLSLILSTGSMNPTNIIFTVENNITRRDIGWLTPNTTLDVIWRNQAYNQTIKSIYRLVSVSQTFTTQALFVFFNPCDSTLTPAIRLEASASVTRIPCNQCFFLSRNIGQVTLKISNHHYLKKIFSGSKHPKNSLFIL